MGVRRGAETQGDWELTWYCRSKAYLQTLQGLWYQLRVRSGWGQVSSPREGVQSTS